MKAAALLGSIVASLSVAGCSVDQRSPETALPGAGGASPGSGGPGAAGPSSAAGPSGAALVTSSGGASGTLGAGGSAARAGELPGGDSSGGNLPVGNSQGSSNASGGPANGGNTGAGAAGSGSAGTSGGLGYVPCAGCVELVVPVTGPEQGASYQFQFPAPGEDFSLATVVWRVQVLEQDANAAFFLTTDVQNGLAHSYAGLFANYTPLSTYSFPPGEWVELTVDVSALAPAQEGMGFDRTAVESVALALGTTEAFTGSANLRVLVDSVLITGVSGVESATFSNGVDALRLNPFDAPAGTGEPIHHP